MYCKSIVIADLPRAGLANRLLVWAKACIFAKENELKLVTSGWFKLHIGPWLRKEKIKRYYGYYFKTFKIDSIINKILAKISKNQLIYEPKVSKLGTSDIQNKIFIFNKIPHESDYFVDLRGYAELIKKELFNLLKPSIIKQLNISETPIIAVHIRMSDFRAIKEGEVFGLNGAVRTPLSYFKNTIEQIRMLSGKELPVTIFSDGYPYELNEILSMPKVKMAAKNSDIVDLLLLSKSKILITSMGSTFSYFAAFLSENIIIHHPACNSKLITSNNSLYEGPLQSNIKTLLIKYNV